MITPTRPAPLGSDTKFSLYIQYIYLTPGQLGRLLNSIDQIFESLVRLATFEDGTPLTEQDQVVLVLQDVRTGQSVILQFDIFKKLQRKAPPWVKKIVLATRIILELGAYAKTGMEVYQILKDTGVIESPTEQMQPRNDDKESIQMDNLQDENNPHVQVILHRVADYRKELERANILKMEVDGTRVQKPRPPDGSFVFKKPGDE